MSNVPLPRPGPLGLIQYAGIDMLQYAGEAGVPSTAKVKVVVVVVSTRNCPLYAGCSAPAISTT